MNTRMKRRRRLAVPVPAVATRVEPSTGGRAPNHGLVNRIVSRYRHTGVGGVRGSCGAVLLVVGLMISAVLPAAATQAQAPLPRAARRRGLPTSLTRRHQSRTCPRPATPRRPRRSPIRSRPTRYAATGTYRAATAIAGPPPRRGGNTNAPSASTRATGPLTSAGDLCASPSTCWGYPHNCYAIFEQRTDHFMWDGTGVVFYGQAYEIAVENGGGPSFSDALFWDGPTARWYSLVPRHVLTVSKTGVGSGVVTAFPGGIDCGDTCRASYPAGTEIVLGVQPERDLRLRRMVGGLLGPPALLPVLDRPGPVSDGNVRSSQHPAHRGVRRELRRPELQLRRDHLNRPRRGDRPLRLELR